MTESKKPTKDSSVKSYLEWSDKGKSSIWRYILGSILMIIVFFALSGMGAIPVTIIDPNYKDSLIESNLALMLVFVISFVAIPLIVGLLHKRPYWSVAMPKFHIEKWNLLIGFVVSTLVGLIAVVVFSLLGYIDLEYVGIDWGTWLSVAAIGLIGIFIQAGSEEMLFRGYFAQFTRRITKNPYVIIFVPALLFAIPHYSNLSQYSSGLIVLLPYLINGVLYGYIAYRTGSLWMSLGLHMSNNLSGMLLVGTKADVLETVSPLVFGLPSLELSTVVIGVQAVAIVAIILPLVKRREARVAEISA